MIKRNKDNYIIIIIMQYDLFSNDKIQNLLKANNYLMDDQNHINTILEDLQLHIFSSLNLEKYAKHTPESKPKVFNQIKPKDRFEPMHKDTLFWCFYVLHMGLDKYEMIGNKHFVEEKQLKFKLIELIRSKKDVLKMHKIRPLYELEDDLANKQQISLKTFIALCIINNISIVVVDKHKYYENIHIASDSDSSIHIVHKSIGDPVKYSVDLLSNMDKINHYRDHYYNTQSLENKLKSITSYKCDELLEICKKLGVEIPANTKKKTKAELYEIIILNL